MFCHIWPPLHIFILFVISDKKLFQTKRIVFSIAIDEEEYSENEVSLRSSIKDSADVTCPEYFSMRTNTEWIVYFKTQSMCKVSIFPHYKHIIIELFSVNTKLFNFGSFMFCVTFIFPYLSELIIKQVFISVGFFFGF